jgi:predicted dehydrogenase
MINWGIIGVGDVTEVKSGPAFYKLEHSKLVAVMRRNAEKAKDYAQRHNVPTWYSNANDLINDPRINAIYIATPPDSHASYAIQAMNAGKPVYVEKPMARSYKECLEMIKVSEQTGMPLLVAYYRRTLPAFLKVKELITKGSIGKPLMVNIKLYKQAEERGKKHEDMSWHVSPEIAGAGHFFDLASHQFDYLDFIFGEITKVNGIASNQAGLYTAEDTVTGTWRHESGIIGAGSWCFIINENDVEDTIEIIGENGKISFPCFSPGKLQLTKNNKTSYLSFKNPKHISQKLVQQAIDEFRGTGKCVSTAYSAARTNWVMDEMVKNYYT